MTLRFRMLQIWRKLEIWLSRLASWSNLLSWRASRMSCVTLSAKSTKSSTSANRCSLPRAAVNQPRIMKKTKTICALTMNYSRWKWAIWRIWAASSTGRSAICRRSWTWVISFAGLFQCKTSHLYLKCEAYSRIYSHKSSRSRLKR